MRPRSTALAALTLTAAFGCGAPPPTCAGSCAEGRGAVVDLTVLVTADRGSLASVGIGSSRGARGTCSLESDGSWTCRMTVRGGSDGDGPGPEIQIEAPGQSVSLGIFGCCEERTQTRSVELRGERGDAGQDSDAGGSDAGADTDAGDSDAGDSDAGADAGPPIDAGTQVVTQLPNGTVSTDTSDCRAANPPPMDLTRTTVVTLEVDAEGQGPQCVDLAITEPASEVAYRGTVLFGSRTGGGSWYSDDAVDGGGPAALMALADEGFRVIQRAWQRGGWLRGAPGSQSGFAARSAKLAQLAAYIDQTYVDGGPFCLTGQSGGAMEVALAGTHWGLQEIADLIVPTAGPAYDAATLCYSDAAVYSGVAECERWPAILTTEQCAGGWVCGNSTQYGARVDVAHDDLPAGTCALDNPSAAAVAQLAGDSVLAPSAQRHFPQTAWRTIAGVMECGMLAAGAAGLAEALAAAGTDATFTHAPGAHGVPNTAAGLDVIVGAIRADYIQRH